MDSQFQYPLFRIRCSDFNAANEALKVAGVSISALSDQV